MSLIPLITIESIPFDVFVGISSRYAQYLSTPPLRVRINTRSDLLPQVALTCLLIASSRPDICTNCRLNQIFRRMPIGEIATVSVLFMYKRKVIQENIPLGCVPIACQLYILRPQDVSIGRG